MKNKVLLIALVAALSACGGGGSDSAGPTTAAAPQVTAPQPAPTVATQGDMTKYAGTWTTACMPVGQQSARMTLALTASPKEATGKMNVTAYVQQNCAGLSVQDGTAFTANFVEMVGAAEKLSVFDGSEKGNMLATFSADGLTLTLAEEGDTFVFIKQ